MKVLILVSAVVAVISCVTAKKNANNTPDGLGSNNRMVVFQVSAASPHKVGAGAKNCGDVKCTIEISGCAHTPAFVTTPDQDEFSLLEGDTGCEVSLRSITTENNNTYVSQDRRLQRERDELTLTPIDRNHYPLHVHIKKTLKPGDPVTTATQIQYQIISIAHGGDIAATLDEPPPPVAAPPVPPVPPVPHAPTIKEYLCQSFEHKQNNTLLIKIGTGGPDQACDFSHLLSSVKNLYVEGDGTEYKNHISLTELAKYFAKLKKIYIFNIDKINFESSTATLILRSIGKEEYDESTAKYPCKKMNPKNKVVEIENINVSTLEVEEYQQYAYCPSSSIAQLNQAGTNYVGTSKIHATTVIFHSPIRPIAEILLALDPFSPVHLVINTPRIDSVAFTHQLGSLTIINAGRLVEVPGNADTYIFKNTATNRPDIHPVKGDADIYCALCDTTSFKCGTPKGSTEREKCTITPK